MKEVSFKKVYLDIGYINNQGLIHINKTTVKSFIYSTLCNSICFILDVD